MNKQTVGFGYRTVGIATAPILPHSPNRIHTILSIDRQTKYDEINRAPHKLSSPINKNLIIAVDAAIIIRMA
jgi:hypothetical protein